MPHRQAPRWLHLEQTVYHAFARLRDIALAPLSSLLTHARINPNMVSLFGVIMALLFAILIRRHHLLATICLALAILADLVDGPLARHQATASDRGKVIDMVSDTSTFAIVVIGLIYANFLSGALGLTYLASMLISKILRIIYHTDYLTTDWLFRPVAGFLPGLFVTVTYVLTLLSFFTAQDILFFPLTVFTIVLTADALLYYFYLLIYRLPNR